MDPPAIAQFRDDLLEWAEDNLRGFPWRDPGASLYEVFVAEILLTQTPAENVAAVYPDFVAEYPSLKVLSAADAVELERAIEPLGFQRMRAEALTEIAAEHDEIPTDRDALLSLPQVGEYVADATLCFALQESRPLLDRNVERVYSRVFESSWPTDLDRRRTFAAELLPADGEMARQYNLAPLDFGAALCTRQTQGVQSAGQARTVRRTGTDPSRDRP